MTVFTLLLGKERNTLLKILGRYKLKKGLHGKLTFICFYFIPAC